MFELSTEVLLRALLFILVFFMVFEGLKRFFKDKKISGVVGFAVALIASFFVTNEQLLSFFNTAGTTGIIVLIGFPFMVAFVFIYSSKIPSGVRKIFWVFYASLSIFLLGKANLPSETATSIMMILIIFFIILLIADSWMKKQFLEKSNLARGKK